MLVEQQLLSKVLNEENFFILNKFKVNRGDFAKLGDIYQFLKDYASKTGKTPSVETVVEEFESFEYEPTVVDTFGFLSEKLKSDRAKRMIYDVVQNQLTSKWETAKGKDLAEFMKAEFDRITMETSTRASEGTDFSKNGMERLSWYEERKRAGSDIFVKTPYETLNEWLGGGMELGDYILLQAYTNRGKSFIVTDFGLTAWNHGFGVMHYAPELSKEQQLNRMDTLQGHYELGKLRTAELKNEDNYKKYLEDFKEETEKSPYIVKSMDDMESGLTLDMIEADIIANPHLKVFIIDGLLLMDHKGRGKQRDVLSGTSRKLRQLFGKHKVLGIVVHQVGTAAEKENRELDDLGNRIPNPPRIDQYSESIAMIQDACTILNFDQSDGVGALRLAKSRVGNVDNILELNCNFGLGYIDEIKEKDSVQFLSI